MLWFMLSVISVTLFTYEYDVLANLSMFIFSLYYVLFYLGLLVSKKFKKLTTRKEAYWSKWHYFGLGCHCIIGIYFSIYLFTVILS